MVCVARFVCLLFCNFLVAVVGGFACFGVCVVLGFLLFDFRGLACELPRDTRFLWDLGLCALWNFGFAPYFRVVGFDFGVLLWWVSDVYCGLVYYSF